MRERTVATETLFRGRILTVQRIEVEVERRISRNEIRDAKTVAAWRTWRGGAA